LFEVPKSAEDKVLVLIRMNGGNDGLNMVFPRDQYAELVIQRANILVPESSILTLTTEVGLHPKMTGLQTLFNEGKLSVLQNVGYPEPNRSHFRSTDIWTTGALDINQTSGWLGRYFDASYPNFPEAYPNVDYPDPFAISMGSEVSATCQGLVGNFSHAVNDPFSSSVLPLTPVVNDGTYYGSHIEYISTLINQTNEYGQQITSAAVAGNSLSNLYDPQNPLAVQLKYIAQMISGGLKTKVYILNINGFDTHDAQVDANDVSEGAHAILLQRLSDAIRAFQHDLQLLGLEQRVAGMTFSEFGRQIASNGSLGTDHGDAAPLILFGACISTGIVGANPQIPNQVNNQAGLPMQIDFRDVYASLLKDWFEVDPNVIQSLFEQNIQYLDLLQGCTNAVENLDGTYTVFICVSSGEPECVIDNNQVTCDPYVWIIGDQCSIETDCINLPLPTPTPTRIPIVCGSGITGSNFFYTDCCWFPAFVDSGNQFCTESLTFSSTKKLGQTETSYLQSIKNIQNHN
jgi:uncharacterized protein (DUF1501 family)